MYENQRQDKRLSYVDSALESWGRWSRERRMVQGYPNKAAIANVIDFGPGGAAAIHDASYQMEEEYPLEESIEQAVVAMKKDGGYHRAVECLKAKYVGLIRSQYYTDLPDTEAAKYLRVARQRYYEELDRARRFVDGWMSAKGL